MLDIDIHQGCELKKMVTPSDKIGAAGYLEEQYEITERKVYQVLALNRNTKSRQQRY